MMNCKPKKGEVKTLSFSGDPFLIGSAVFLAFWNRPDCLKKMLERLRKVRPHFLLFYQNASLTSFSEEQCKAYKTASDIANQFINGIDWQCVVSVWKPVDCADVWHSLTRAYVWAFSLYEQCIVLEDDDLPSFSWFFFASSMLEKYQNDSKVALISSEVNFEFSKKYSRKFAYIFSTYVSIHGWACWRRTINAWDWDYSWLDNPEKLDLLRKYYGKRRAKRIIERAGIFRQQKTPNFELYFAAYLALNNAFTIIPTKNMLQNTGLIGIHSSNLSIQTRKEKRYFNKRVFEFVPPLKEPPYLFYDLAFDRSMGAAIKNGFWNKTERCLRLLLKGELWSYLKKKKQNSI